MLPVFGDLFVDEPIPARGYLTTADLDKPGFGLTIRPSAWSKLIPSSKLLHPTPGQVLAFPSPPGDKCDRRKTETASCGVVGTLAAQAGR